MTTTPHLRACLFIPVLLLASAPAAARGQSSGARLPFADTSSRWHEAIAIGRRALQGMVDRGAAPGVAVAVAVDGRIVWTAGFGFADVERRVPATRQTRFGLGSLSKTFTMAAAMSLVDEGRLDLDAPIERYLPDFPHGGRGITVRRLAAHQSGLSDDYAREHYNTTTHIPLDSAYRAISRAPLDFEPGSDTSYATGPYTIIGRVLEAVDGRAYRELMKARLFDRVGMPAAMPNDPRVPIPERTCFYVAGENGHVPAPPLDPAFKLPGAGFIASAEDVARFGSALLRPGLLSDSARREMIEMVPLADGRSTDFALGLRVAEENGRRVLHQPGGGVGISTWLFIYPEHDLVMALLSNVATAPVGGRARREIAEAFLRAMDAR